MMVEQKQENKLDVYLHKLFKREFDVCELDDSLWEKILDQARLILLDEGQPMDVVTAI